MQEYQHAMDDWSRFTQETLDQYGVDMGVLNTPYRAEQQKYFLQASIGGATGTLLRVANTVRDLLLCAVGVLRFRIIYFHT